MKQIISALVILVVFASCAKLNDDMVSPFGADQPDDLFTIIDVQELPFNEPDRSKVRVTFSFNSDRLIGLEDIKEFRIDLLDEQYEQSLGFTLVEYSEKESYTTDFVSNEGRTYCISIRATNSLGSLSRPFNYSCFSL